MDNKKLITKYNELRNMIILANRKKQILKEQESSANYIDLLGDSIGIYNGFIDENTNVVVGGTTKNLKSFKTGNLDEVYSKLISKVKINDINNEEDLMNKLKIVYDIVIKYFGYGDVNKRIDYYNYNDNVTLESLKSKNLAVCLEDATLSQNMLKLLGINSTLKVSLVQYEDGRYDTHAYNLISYDNKYYLFDSRFPHNNNPVVRELDENEYLCFMSGTDETTNIKECSNNIIYYACNIPLKKVSQKK